MTKQTIELKRLFQRTAQAALKSEYGFSPKNLSDIEIFDGNGRADFKIRVVDKEYQFKSSASSSVTSLDSLNVWVGKGTITKLN